jgi:hypothetical protein
MNQKQSGILLSVIVLVASLIGIAMAVNNFMAKKSALEQSNRDVEVAQAELDSAVRDYNNYVNSH